MQIGTSHLDSIGFSLQFMVGSGKEQIKCGFGILKCGRIRWRVVYQSALAGARGSTSLSSMSSEDNGASRKTE